MEPSPQDLLPEGIKHLQVVSLQRDTCVALAQPWGDLARAVQQ